MARDSDTPTPAHAHPENGPLMNTSDIANLMRVLQAAYPHTEITDEMYELWYNAFAENGTSQVTLAARTWIDTEQYFPTVAGIRQKMADNIRQQAREAAWTPRSDPHDHTVSFEDGRTIAALAYERHCEAEGREPNWAHWNKSMGLDGKPMPR